MPTASNAAPLRRESYIPGFDWVRLIGASLVVLVHCGVLAPFIQRFNFPAFLMLTSLVPAFFLTSGWLIAEKLGDWAYVLGYVKKYACLYLAANLLRIAMYAAQHLLLQHDFSSSGILEGLALLPFKSVFVVPLWFIPALLHGVLVNALLRERPRAMQAVLVLCLAVIVAHALTFRLDASYPARSIARGILFVYLGALRRKRTFPLWLLVAVAAALLAFELSVRYLDLAVIALALLVFEVVLRMKGGFLYPHHRLISVFSVLSYFLHPFEFILLRRFGVAGVASASLILVCNALLALLICAILKKRNRTDGV